MIPWPPEIVALYWSAFRLLLPGACKEAGTCAILNIPTRQDRSRLAGTQDGGNMPDNDRQHVGPMVWGLRIALIITAAIVAVVVWYLRSK